MVFSITDEAKDQKTHVASCVWKESSKQKSKQTKIIEKLNVPTNLTDQDKEKERIENQRRFEKNNIASRKLKQQITKNKEDARLASIEQQQFTDSARAQVRDFEKQTTAKIRYKARTSIKSKTKVHSNTSGDNKEENRDDSVVNSGNSELSR